EKITASFEHLPDDWPVHGETGYRFANVVNRMLVDSATRTRMDRAYRQFIDEPLEWREVAYQSQQLVLRRSLASELNVATNLLARLARADRRTRDFTFNTLRTALAERGGRRARPLRRRGARLPRRLRIPREARAARDARDLHPRHQALRGRACAAQRALRDEHAVARGGAALEPLQPLAPARARGAPRALAERRVPLLPDSLRQLAARGARRRRRRRLSRAHRGLHDQGGARGEIA